MRDGKMWFITAVVSLALLLFSAGCSRPNPGSGSPAHVFHQVNSTPRSRMGCYATSTMGTKFIDLNNIGRHQYRSPFETNGIVYTCRAGHIDTAHLRKSADWTAYLACKTYKAIKAEKPGFKFRMKEASGYYVTLQYPPNWEKLTKEQKDKVAFETSVALGQYLCYTATNWHEILTWFGYKATGLYTEFPSAFSWEDVVSNLIGTRIGAQALLKPDPSYNDSVTYYIDEELERLGARPARVAKKASDSVRDKWYYGDALFFVTITGRNYDIGTDDGFVTPWLVPGISECPDATVESVPVPKITDINRYGFSAKLEIRPSTWEGKKIRRAIRYISGETPDTIIPDEHYPMLMKYMQHNPPEVVLPFLGPQENGD